MKKKILTLLCALAIVALAFVNVQITSSRSGDFSLVSLTKLNIAFAEDSESGGSCGDCDCNSNNDCARGYDTATEPNIGSIHCCHSHTGNTTGHRH